MTEWQSNRRMTFLVVAVVSRTRTAQKSVTCVAYVPGFGGIPTLFLSSKLATPEHIISVSGMAMHPDRHRKIRALFDEYIELYASRDARLTTRFSENFSGYTGGGDFLAKVGRQGHVSSKRCRAKRSPIL